MRRLFVDMDGTLARFHDEQMYLERMFEKGFFRNLNPFSECVEAIKHFQSMYNHIEVYILSATVDGIPPYCLDEKHAWLDEHLPQIDRKHRIFTKVGQNKAELIPGGISQGDVLLDDYNKNLEEWEKAGGVAIKAKNNINHKGLVGELWQGKLVDIMEPSRQMCARLSCILNPRFGNTSYEELGNQEELQVYSFDEITARKISKELDAAGIKYSGIVLETTMLTIKKCDNAVFEQIRKNLSSGLKR